MKISQTPDKITDSIFRINKASFLTDNMEITIILLMTTPVSTIFHRICLKMITNMARRVAMVIL